MISSGKCTLDVSGVYLEKLLLISTTRNSSFVITGLKSMARKEFRHQYVVLHYLQ